MLHVSIAPNMSNTHHVFLFILLPFFFLFLFFYCNCSSDVLGWTLIPLQLRAVTWYILFFVLILIVYFDFYRCKYCWSIESQIAIFCRRWYTIDACNFYAWHKFRSNGSNCLRRIFGFCNGLKLTALCLRPNK